MRQIGLHIIQDTRQMRPILRLVIAQGQTDKYAGNFQIALQTQNGERFAKPARGSRIRTKTSLYIICLLYTSDAADEP